MTQFRSQIAPLIEKFILYRKASGSWNETCYGLNIKLFDHFCAENHPASTELKQAMVDGWCTKRETECNSSYNVRTNVIRIFIAYLISRSIVTVTPPIMLKPENKTYIPHAFEENELIRFFHECDSIIPYLKRRASLIRKLTLPVF